MQLIPYLLSLILLFLPQATPAASITKVCFARGEFIYVKDLKTGLEKRVAKGSYPSISPDGRMVAYSVDNTSGSNMTREIRLVDLQTGKVTSFDSLKPYLCYEAIWSPDGKRIAFALFKDSHWHVTVLDVDTGDWKILSEKISATTGMSVNSWTADSSSVLGQDLDFIYQFSLNGEVLRKISVSDIVDDISYVSSATTFALSPDGKSLVFDTEVLPDDPRPPMIWVYDMQNKARKRISPKSLGALNPLLVTSGEEIIFTGVGLSKGRKQRPGVYRMRRDGTQVQLLVANAEQGSVALGQ